MYGPPPDDSCTQKEDDKEEIDALAATNDSRTMLERMRAGELHIIVGDFGDDELKKLWEVSKTRCARYSAEGLLLGESWRSEKLAEMLGSVGKGSDINPPFHCSFGFNIHLGERVFLNFNCVILDVAKVEIGDDTLIGPGVQLLAVEHPRDAKARFGGWESGRPIRIGRNVWIGGGAIILPGVCIGDGAIVGAGAVVNKDVETGSTVVGVPAKPIRKM